MRKRGDIDQRHLEQVGRMSTSERLREWASMGVKVREGGPVEESAYRFGQRILHEGWLGMGADLEPVELRENVHALHCMGRWAQYGFNVFELSPDLAAGFLLTDPAPVEGELKLPFPCFFIRLPPGIVPIFVHGQQHWAEGLWCHRFTAHHHTAGDDTPFFRWIIEWKSVSLWTDRLPTELEGCDEDNYTQIWEGDPPFVPEDSISLDRSLRIIKNLLSWLDATGGLEQQARPQPPHVKRKASKARQQDLDAGTWPHVWIFGKDVKLRPELRRMAQEFALAQSAQHNRPGWKLRARLVIRGHFKQQAYGEGKLLRRRIWVEPYWRGPEGAAAWAHLYDVAPPKKDESQ